MREARHTLAIACAVLVFAGPAGADDSPPSGEGALARTLYARHCATCHGSTGAGDGPAAPYLEPAPRDLTRGEYKFRSTRTGSVPTDADLMRVIANGVRGTSMPGWSGVLGPAERRALVARVKSFSDRFVDAAPASRRIVPIPAAPTGSIPDSVARGRKLYASLRCGTCHGDDGRGGGPAADFLRDNQERSIRAYDFTTGDMKGGGSPVDVYRTFVTGMDGTPMPSYREAVQSEREGWDLVHFVISLYRTKSAAEYLFVDQPGR